ncbi:DUF4955 domain-containing protein [Pontiella sulfatireligans]|uniref:Pectate lyase superfamily protein domain-containing protein n=1 Tax=Pontiella sulfatireligans TaxID=2750658 RepID=A0A6C2UF39_9BACT|nr:DUF4955 domain-containing protein [Pontiella sulfatireligans]VGO18147.1 hypothetical protein SCARR_00198 [Pontiella sulfatireligans]
MMKTVSVAFCLLCLCALASAETSKVWKEWVSGKPVIPDYSWAGYKYGTEAIPEVSWKVFNVVDYGAVANDGKSDYDAIQKTIKAAEANGSGIVFFPVGKFLVAEQEGRTESIKIHGANIVLRGSGSGTGGTEIHQKHHYVPEDTTKKWTTPPVFSFETSGSGAYHFRLRESFVPVTTVAGAEKNGTFRIDVADASKFKMGQTIMLHMQNSAANNDFLKGLTPRDICHEIIDNGVSVAEKHTVVKVEGHTLVLQEPLHTDIDPGHGWKVYDYPTTEGWGVEDIHFSGNSPTPFVHHKDYIHDSGYFAVEMVQGKNGWIRRCRFTNLSHACFATGCMATSFLMNTVDGHQGHGNFNTKWGYGNLIGLCQDLSDIGSFHGCGISHEHVGGVIWRYESVGETKQTPRCGGPDFHAQFPYCSLWDASVANLRNNGGASFLQPNHLVDLTFWNFEQIGEKIHHDYWNMPKTAEEKKNMYFGKTKIVYPNYIGFHGVMSTFNEDHLGIVESYGTPVEPESLYEAQLAQRLGGAPAWVADAKAAWKKVKAIHREAGQ